MTYSKLMEIDQTTAMTLEGFIAEYETLQDEGREKEASLLVCWEPELYRRYWVEVCGEEWPED
jgi:hypothetical protein